MTETLVVKGLSKSYESSGALIHALRGIDLVVEAGELVAVMGPSGCGKTTLLNLLGGLDDPTSGEIHLAGLRVDTLSERHRAIMRRRQIGIVFQAYNLIGNLTVSDNVELPALMAGFSTGEARARRETLFEELGIADKSGESPSGLSGGQQQRVAMARALVNRPALLLADEPTGNLDFESSVEVVELLRRYNAEGQTIVMVTHNPRVASIASRIVRMRDGEITDEVRMNSETDPRAVLTSLIDLGV